MVDKGSAANVIALDDDCGHNTSLILMPRKFQGKYHGDAMGYFE